MKTYYVYILSNKHKTVFYTGVTNNLERRLLEHLRKINSSFTAKYNINTLLFYESFNSIYEAINAEKRIKGITRAKKLLLIKINNPLIRDLFEVFDS